ncbi:No apical meristem (NAM) protein [Artemisia annua]|uniref:No apical meristem (NAM) protein n=1 Tax=Artemisia annua TaxID=35608 RepID=A0A2U1MYR2_ARTAN|nr:No apical meristem (NAM) protein [Artemisia annua]
MEKQTSSMEKLFPPGFRFHPTDEELVLYWLKRKICGRSLKIDIIGDLDVYKWDPDDFPGLAKWKTGDRQWFFFCPRDRRYPSGARANRATMHGYWKATGKDRIITCNSRTVGSKKTLIYYLGRAPSGQRTDWVMHEYTLDEEELSRCNYVKNYYNVCKFFKKSGAGPKNGEQYGAPFVEEEWADDGENVNVDALLVQNTNTFVNEPNPTSAITAEPAIVPPMAQINPVIGEGFDQRVANEPSVEEQHHFAVNEDFIELDDLISPQPALPNSEQPVVDDLPFDDVDEFCAFDFCNDSTTLNKTNPVISQHIQHPFYATNLEYGMENSDYRSYFNTNIEADHNIPRTDQSNHNLTDPQASEHPFSTPSGVITDVNQCLNNGEGYGGPGSFSSALWDYVESVPTSPAFALESSALVNKVFEQIPCSLNKVSSTKNGARRVKRSSRSSSMGILYFSVLGVLFAILCVFLGTSIELLGRSIL